MKKYGYFVTILSTIALASTTYGNIEHHTHKTKTPAPKTQSTTAAVKNEANPNDFMIGPAYANTTPDGKTYE